MANVAERALLDYQAWLSDVDQRLRARCAISLRDAALEEAQLRLHWSRQQPADEFVAWYSQQCDLTFRNYMDWMVRLPIA